MQGSPSSILTSLYETEAIFSRAQGGRASWKVLGARDRIPSAAGSTRSDGGSLGSFPFSAWTAQAVNSSVRTTAE